MIEEEEQFTELASSEVLMQQLRAFLDTGGREVVENLPDGIHSGIQRNGARGLFFYFRTNRGDKEQSFWRYYDLKTNNILDNRHVLATLIACSPDTPRVVDTEIYGQVFALQEKVIDELLRGYEEKAALQIAPKALDPLQQTVATVIQNFLNHPQLQRKRAISIIEFLNTPMLRVQLVN